VDAGAADAQAADARGAGDAGPLCQPSGGDVCDLVCQVGCPSGSRCALDPAGVRCTGGTGTFPVGERCDVTGAVCVAGSTCLGEARDVCGARCYKHCRVDADCGPEARCADALEFDNGRSYGICSRKISACDPVGEARCADPSGAPSGCYLLSPSSAPDLAICECAGTATEGAACTFEHECRPGLECVDVGGASTCRPVCRLGGAPCAGGRTCTAFDLPGGARSQAFGYCR
jgi:hypothetical protein